MSGSGGFSSGPGFNGFVDGHFYRQRYKNVGFCSKKYKTKFVSAVGDSFPAPAKAKKPAKDPYGRSTTSWDCGSSSSAVGTPHASDFSRSGLIADIARLIVG
jgi:hypothetical protein